MQRNKERGVVKRLPNKWMMHSRIMDNEWVSTESGDSVDKQGQDFLDIREVSHTF